MMNRFLRLLITGTVLALTTGMAAAQMSIGFGGVAHDANQPVEVTSDSLSIDQATGEAVFAGNVVLVQGDLRMSAGRIEVAYADIDGSRQVQSVSATGGVLVTRGADAAEGEEAIYAVDTSLLTMTGEVLVTQGANAIAGDRLIVDMATGNGTVEGRVRTVLDTGSDE